MDALGTTLAREAKAAYLEHQNHVCGRDTTNPLRKLTAAARNASPVHQLVTRFHQSNKRREAIKMTKTEVGACSVVC